LDEVISVVARRRRWTLEQKLALVEEVSRPGASVAAVADRHGMSRSLLFEWRRQVREGTMPGVVRADAAATLVPVRIVGDGPPKETPRPPVPSRRSAKRADKSAAVVEVVLSNGRVLRVSEAIAPEVLGRLAAALDT
jgi:transposase